MAGVRNVCQPARKTLAGCACRRVISPRLRRRVLSSPSLVNKAAAVAWPERMNRPVVPELAERE
ncbi:TPA: hypothetical protein JS297_004622 [Escherichia coli]|nr:hypothetical protein [Escherichia coli]